jgi:hypothetical protein
MKKLEGNAKNQRKTKCNMFYIYYEEFLYVFSFKGKWDDKQA